MATCLTKNISAMENKLKELRMQGKISQSALADALSVSRQTINSIENKKDADELKAKLEAAGAKVELK